MALIKCKECGHEISDKATVCPKCGNKIAIVEDKTKGGKGKIGIVVLLSVFVLCIVAIFFINSNGKYINDATKTQSAEVSGDIESQTNRVELLSFHDVFDKDPVEYDENGRVINAVEYENILNINIEKLLKERGYHNLGIEEHEEQRVVEQPDYAKWMAKVKTIRYGYNMDYSGNWEPQGYPCQGVEIVFEDSSMSAVNLYFGNPKDRQTFIDAAIEKGFSKGDKKDCYYMAYSEYDNAEMVLVGEKGLKCYNISGGD